MDRAWQPVLADLEAIRAEVLRQGRGLALAVYPSALQVFPAQRAALVETLRRRPRYAALSCVDLTPAFVEASHVSAESLYKQQDAHWTLRGNRVAAEAEARFLVGLVCPAGAPAPSAATQNHMSFRCRGVQGRQSTASAAKIGYSAIHEKMYGASRPAKRPPSMPPNDGET